MHLPIEQQGIFVVGFVDATVAEGVEEIPDCKLQLIGASNYQWRGFRTTLGKAYKNDS